MCTVYHCTLTIYLLTWRIWWAPNNVCIWQMGFNLAFKMLKQSPIKGKYVKWGIGIYFLFQTFTVFWMVYAFFWVIFRCRNLYADISEHSISDWTDGVFWTSAYTIQMLGNYPEESIQQVYIFLEDVYMIILNCCLVKYGCSAVWASDLFTNDHSTEEVFHIIPPVLTLQCLLHNFNWRYNPWWVLACCLLHIPNIKAHVLLLTLGYLKQYNICIHQSYINFIHKQLYGQQVMCYTLNDMLPLKMCSLAQS